jgi:hypothetical protein
MAAVSSGVVDRSPAWDEPLETPRGRPGVRTLLSLALIVTAVSIAFAVRGICWEALVLALPFALLALVMTRGKDVLVVVGTVVALAIGFVAVEAVNLSAYHSIALSGPPRVIVWCGQILAPAEVVAARSDTDFKRLAHGGPVHTVGVTPQGSSIVAAGTNAAWGCPWQLYVALGHGQWEYYTQDPM